MKTWLCDCNWSGETRFVWAPNWAEASRICEEEDYTLVGEYVETQPGPDWLIDEEDVH